LSGSDGEHAFGVPGLFQIPTDWSADGRFIAYQTSGGVAEPGADILLLDLAHGNRPVPLLQSAAQELAAVFSPDTSSIAFLSNETGRPEVYAQEFLAEPRPHLYGERRRISNDGARLTRWRPDGKELFYINRDNYSTQWLSRSTGAMLAWILPSLKNFFVLKPRLGT
jgi:Tol biopolymer transport system component